MASLRSLRGAYFASAVRPSDMFLGLATHKKLSSPARARAAGANSIGRGEAVVRSSTACCSQLRGVSMSTSPLLSTVYSSSAPAADVLKVLSKAA